jgi:rSAM/selenodomain-associated transferase 2
VTAPVSIVIPTLNAVSSIGPTLGALVPGVADGLVREVVLADGGSTDEIKLVAEECGATLVSCERGRGNQLRAGANAARGDWLLFLHADTVLPIDWTKAVGAHIARYGKKAGWFRLGFDSERRYARWTEGWANIRSRWMALPYGDQGLLISRRLYDEVGGYEALKLMEDVAMARKLGRRRLRCLGPSVMTAADKYEHEGYWKRGWRNWGCLGLYIAGVSPDKIVEIYRRK